MKEPSHPYISQTARTLRGLPNLQQCKNNLLYTMEFYYKWRPGMMSIADDDAELLEN